MSFTDCGQDFEGIFAKGFYWYGCFVSRHPRCFLIGSLIFTGVCLTGIPSLTINLDLFKLFVPADAPVRTEFERQQFFEKMPLGDLVNEHPVKAKPKRQAQGPHKTDIARFYVVRKDYSNLLKSETLGRLFNYTDQLMELTVEHEGITYPFEAFCAKDAAEKKCNNNLNVWLKHADVLFRNGRTKVNPNLQLSYPVMYLFNRPKDIGNVIYGVNVTGEKHEIVGARVLTLHWQIDFVSSPLTEAAYNKFRDRMMEFWLSKSDESGITFIAHNDHAMDDEMLKIISTTVPFAIPAAIQLMLFVILSNYSTDKTRSKPMEANLAVTSVILSLCCTFGILFRAGMAFNPVCSTMPFLVLAVGVDDAFLMLGAWRASDRRLSVEKRMGITMSDAGVSITVTSLTNFGCFALGYFLCSTPAVADFCILTAFGVMMDYLFQITFFAAVMIYGGRKEDTGGLMSCCYRNSVQDEDNQSQVAKIEPKSHDKPYIHRLFGDVYAPFILRKDVMIFSWMLFAVYAILALYGCSTIAVDISPRKYIRDDSDIQKFVHLADKFIWADNVMPTFYVMNPPDLRDTEARERLNGMIYRLERTKYSIGRVATNFWLWEYQRFLNDFPDVDYSTGFYDQQNLFDFFSQLDFQQYRGSVKMKHNSTNGEPCISAFTFRTSFYGLDSWDKRQAELFHWRRIVAEYEDFDVFLSGIFSPFLIDQRKSIAPSSMQSIGSAIAVMAMISIFFLPDKQSVFFMTWSLLSISMGVCGGLSLWGSDLDSVSMGCIVMAIGLAVDFSVHFCYRYHRSEEKTGREKVRDTLSVVGWPVLQAGTSTLVGMATLPFIPAYLVRVFFQTVVLVNVFGLLHALVWLPQLMSALDPCERVPLRLRHPHAH